MDEQKVEFSARASLVAYGVRFQQMGIWAEVSARVKIKQKVRDYTLWREAIEFVKNEVVPIRLKGGQKHMECWTSVFGNVHETWFFTPLENFAAMDKPTGLLLKALGSQEAVNAHVDKSRKYSISIRQFVIRVRPDLSYIKPNAPTPKLAVVIKSELAPQRAKRRSYGSLRQTVASSQSSLKLHSTTRTRKERLYEKASHCARYPGLRRCHLEARFQPGD